MKIGIDLRPLQNGHKYRGIGEVAKQTANRIIEAGVSDGHEFVFYENDEDDPKKLLDMPRSLIYSVVKLGPMPENDNQASKSDKIKRTLREFYGEPIKDTAQCDVFLQYDYAAGVPRNTRTVLIKHDLIPYLFWDKYFESAWVPFRNKAMRTTLRTLFANHKFMHTLRRSLRNAHVIMSVSHSTKHDIEKYFDVPAKKSKVSTLGVDLKPTKTNSVDKPTNWPTKPYLIFVGAGDARRRVDDLVAAYNNLKADGHDLQLVLVGENYKSAEQIPNTIVRNEVLKSSYQDDIILMGYADDESKQKLIAGALAYVYPTKYEGFGIPILESMLLETPVIVYKNSSTEEVGGSHAIYTQNWSGIMAEIKKLLVESKLVREKRVKAAKKHAEQFTWDKTAKVMYDELTRTGGSS